jgi:hypothetical protein
MAAGSDLKGERAIACSARCLNSFDEGHNSRADDRDAQCHSSDCVGCLRFISRTSGDLVRFMREAISL